MYIYIISENLFWIFYMDKQHKYFTYNHVLLFSHLSHKLFLLFLVEFILMENMSLIIFICELKKMYFIIGNANSMVFLCFTKLQGRKLKNIVSVWNIVFWIKMRLLFIFYFYYWSRKLIMYYYCYYLSFFIYGWICSAAGKKCETSFFLSCLLFLKLANYFASTYNFFKYSKHLIYRLNNTAT